MQKSWPKWPKCQQEPEVTCLPFTGLVSLNANFEVYGFFSKLKLGFYRISVMSPQFLLRSRRNKIKELKCETSNKL